MQMEKTPMQIENYGMQIKIIQCKCKNYRIQMKIVYYKLKTLTQYNLYKWTKSNFATVTLPYI